MKKANNKTYQTPRITVVSFQVEEGFAGSEGRGIVEQSRDASTINFGVTEPNGRITEDASNHSGLGQYIDGSSIFGN